MVSMLALMPEVVRAQSNADLQRQIDELKAQVKVLTSALAESRQVVASAEPLAAAPAPAAVPSPELAAASAQSPAAAPPSTPAPKSKPWYERLSLRGYTQMRYNAFLSGDDVAPAGVSRLRSVHDGSISDRSGFSLRRARLVLQGDISDRVSLYLQSDFATAVNNQAGSERREGFAQLRDAYADVFLDKGKSFRLCASMRCWGMKQRLSGSVSRSRTSSIRYCRASSGSSRHCWKT